MLDSCTFACQGTYLKYLFTEVVTLFCVLHVQLVFFLALRVVVEPDDVGCRILEWIEHSRRANSCDRGEIRSDLMIDFFTKY
jgi:hypothetical protein